MGTTYIYKVTQFNDGKGNKLKDTHWNVELNNDGKLKELPKSKVYEEKGKICYKYTPEEAENIRIYAWCNKASKDVSVDVPVIHQEMILAVGTEQHSASYGNKLMLPAQAVREITIKPPMT